MAFGKMGARGGFGSFGAFGNTLLRTASADFVNGVYVGDNLAGLLSCSRAQVGLTYATKADGTLLSFAADTPRITDLGLFVEASATNVLLQSNTYTNASWGKNLFGVASAPIVTASAGTAPDGTNTASRVQFALNGGTTGTDRAQLLQNVTVTATQNYNHSIYIKSNTGSSYAMVFRNSAGASGGAITVTPSWQRFTFNTTNAGASIGFSLEIRGGQAPTNSDSADILIWVSQLELGTVATSPIPTTTGANTRNVDNITASGLLQTLLGSTKSTVTVNTNQAVAATAATLVDANGSILMGKTSGNALTTAIPSGLTTGNTATWTGAVASVLAWTPQGRSLTLNAGTAAADSSAISATAPYHIGSTSGSSAALNGFVQKIAAIGLALALLAGTEFVAWDDSASSTVNIAWDDANGVEQQLTWDT